MNTSLRKVVRAIAALSLPWLLLLYGGLHAAETVTIMATWGGAEEAGFREVLDAFTAKTGIPHAYEGNRDVHIVLKTRIAGGNSPDVAIIPQFGVIVELARERAIVPLNAGGSDPILPAEVLKANYGPGFIRLGTIDGRLYALIVKANSKSTIWYKPPSFKNLGVEPPDTWRELLAISDAYLQRGKTPFAIGGKDGWPLTDWFENIYVRVAGPEMYQKLFATHQVKWTDPTVVEAMQRFREIVHPEIKLAGGAEGTLSTGFIDAFNSVLRPNAAAEMYYEGGFMSAFARQNFPKLVGGRDYAFFPFPAINPTWGKPVVVGGDLAIVFRDTPEIRAFMRFMAGKEANTIWATAKKGAVVSPNKQVPLEVYSPLIRLEAAQLTQAEAFVFDGSDLAPSALGRDALFTALQEFVESPDDLRSILENLEKVAARSY